MNSKGASTGLLVRFWGMGSLLCGCMVFLLVVLWRPGGVVGGVGRELTISHTHTPAGATYAPAPGKPEKLLLTAYCPCRKCCGRWSLGGHFKVTSSGLGAMAGWTAACQKGFEGRLFWLPGFGLRACEDTGSGITSGEADLYFETHAEALMWGRQLREVVWLN